MAAKTAVKTVELIPQPHGGALSANGNPGNKGNLNAIGRPPSIIRERLRGSFENRIGILEEIADGEPVEHFEASFLEILPHVQCPKCKTQMEAKDPAAMAMLSIPAKRSARPGDRIKATDVLAKYGLGEKTELSVVHPDVIAKLQEQVSMIASRKEWKSEELLTALGEIWK